MSAANRKREREAEEKSTKQTWSPALKPATVFKDWFPGPTGDIDLEKFDLPQNKAALEWWYFNTHLVSKKTGQKFSVFYSFFRQRSPQSAQDKAAGKPNEFFDAATWALVDVDNKKYYPDSILDPRACEVIEGRLDPEINGKPLMNNEKALLEIVKQQRLPLPDRQMKGLARVDTKKLHLQLENAELIKEKATETLPDAHPAAPKVVYRLAADCQRYGTEAKLTFQPTQQIARHGLSGVVNDMFYYYIPRNKVSGTIKVNGVVHEVEGSGWYDREFGGKDEDLTSKDALDAWTWFSVQLSDGSDFTLFNIVDRDSNAEREKVAVLTTKDGTRIPVTDFHLTYRNLWCSMNTYVEYPMDWKLTVPSLQLELHMHCAFEHQEFMTILVTGGGFYEGRVHVNGSRNGNAVTGTGFLERKNHRTYQDTKGLLKNVGHMVQTNLQKMYPLDASKEWIDKWVIGRHAQTEGVDPKKVCDTLFRPIRALIDRGGKAWRSLILVSCVNALSTTYMDCSRYIAMSELLHVGSLVIDDIQDESTVRRGGKCVHMEFGVAHAINSGTGCYFMAPILSGVDDLPNDQQLRMYQLYFDAMRAGHAGQGLDMEGLDYLMPAVVENGDTRAILAALRAIHIYKTGGAAGTMCRMACVLTNASEVQSNALEHFGCQIGLAFQIVDDALNLKGFEGDLKEVGEDIRDGKITYPVIKALGRVDRADREYIWEILQEKTSDRGKIKSVIDKLNAVHAIDDCMAEAREIVESAWKSVDPVIPDSLPKIMMRTFCLYLTERTY